MDDYQKLMDKKNERYQIGITIIIILGVLTIGEFMLGDTGLNVTSVLWGIAIVKAFMVVRDYMHISRLFGGGEDH
jgi:hypothetical protein